MNASFLGSNYSPYIIIKFDDGSTYKYSGFELGFMNIVKRKFGRKPGQLVKYLKSLKSISCDRIC